MKFLYFYGLLQINILYLLYHVYNCVRKMSPQGIPEQAELAPSAQPPASGLPVNPSAQATQPTVPSGGPNANPLDLFPQVVICYSLVFI